MYGIYKVKDVLTISPDNFDRNINDVAEELLKKKYEGRIDRDMGVIVAIFNVTNISDGVIYPGDPATHHDVELEVLSYMPKVEEINNGEVTELVEFGVFVRIGPMEGLVHVSQIANEFFSFDKRIPTFISKQTGKSIKKGDAVFVKVSTVSMKGTVKDSKIALTMKPEGLGKPDWATSDAMKNRQNQQRRPRKGGSLGRGQSSRGQSRGR